MTHTGPSGWTLEVTLDEQEDRRATIWTKRAGGSEPANYTWSKASGGDYRVGGIAAFSGGITSNPYVDVKGAGDIGFQTTTATASSVTTTVVDTVVIDSVVAANGSGAITPPTGMTEIFDMESNGWGEMSYVLQASIGATGAKVATLGGTDQSGTVLVVFKPAAAGGRTTRNTRAWPLGVEIGMGWRMPV